MCQFINNKIISNNNFNKNSNKIQLYSIKHIVK